MVATGEAPVAIATGDVDGNGVEDVIVANYGSDDITIIASPVFGGRITTISVDKLPHSLTVVDWNGDQRLDVLVGHEGADFVSVVTTDADRQFTRREV